MNKRVAMAAMATLFTLASGCGAGVPVQLKLDEFDFELSIDDTVDTLIGELRTQGTLPPEASDLPEEWPSELPTVCFDILATTNPDDGGRIDLTPDPDEDPEAAETFKPINDGLVERIELDRLVVRVEQNTLNVALPPIEIQAADDKDADTDDRRAWRTVGSLGGPSIGAGCGAKETDRIEALLPTELKDIDFVFHRSGESYLNAQLADEDCLERQMENGGVSSKLACKEFALRARTRLVLDSSRNPARPRGLAKLRLILVATFFVTPL